LSIYCSRDALDAVNDEIPDNYYLPYFADVASRAREILDPKTSVQIHECAAFVCFLIEQVLRDIDHGEALLDVADGRENDEYTTEASQISENRALKQSLHERFGDIDPMVVFDLRDWISGSWHPSELFAVLTLLLLAQAIQIYDASLDDLEPGVPPKLMERFKEAIGDRTEAEIEHEVSMMAIRGSAAYALKAVEAVNYAERLKRGHDRAVIDFDRKETKSRALNEAKHAEKYEIEELVTTAWFETRSKFSSAPKAANHFSQWLQQQGRKTYEPSTIASWIRKHAKLKGVKLR
jgi:hypothetical protein